MGKESGRIVTDFKERIISLAGLKLALLKLSVCERAARISAALAHSILLLVLGLFAVQFVFFTLGFFLGELTGRLSWGFLTVSCVCLVILLIVYCRKKRIRLALANLIVGSILNEDEEEKQTGDSAGETPPEAA